MCEDHEDGHEIWNLCRTDTLDSIRVVCSCGASEEVPVWQTTTPKGWKPWDMQKLRQTIEALCGGFAPRTAFQKAMDLVHTHYEARDRKHFQGVDAQDVVAYLETHGWSLCDFQPHKDAVRIYVKGNDAAWVPFDTSFGDYALRMSEVIHQVVKDERGK